MQILTIFSIYTQQVTIELKIVCRVS